MEPILIVALLVGVYMAWNIGANDVANAMGTSVGSGALTFKRAVVLAAIFEFSGAILAGGNVTSTIRKGIVDQSYFVGDPMIIAYGMCAALLASAIWLNLASALGWPVSTTHSIVGAVVGFALAAGGGEAVQWFTMGKVVASWFISPIMGGIIGFVVFTFIRREILNKPNPATAAKRYGPWMLIPVGMILTLAFLYKGLKNLKLDFTFAEALPISLACGVGLALVGLIIIPRYLNKYESIDSQSDRETGMDPRYIAVERVFIVLQIITACMVAFAHGSNDVANAVGPLAAVYGIVESGELSKQVGIPIWILAMGGAGIVIGLATYGYRVIHTIGKKITEMTPTRGFSAEFAAATTILVGSRLGLPLSTTHTLVGSVIGVGLARGIAAIDKQIIRGIFLSWVVTVPFTGLLAAVIFALIRVVA